MSQISMVFQKVYLFEDTIYNNIAMGRPDAPYVTSCCLAAGLILLVVGVVFYRVLKSE
jgi:ABC-type multidrug transport system fused ATPase/permease subunit